MIEQILKNSSEFCVIDFKNYLMIRTVVTPRRNILSFNIPDKYIGKRLEIIAFAMDEPSDEILYSGIPQKKFSAVKLNTRGFKFNREEANER